MKTVRFVSPAEREMAQAAQYYNSKVPDLGAEFLHEVKKAVKRLEADQDSAAYPLDIPRGRPYMHCQTALNPKGGSRKEADYRICPEPVRITL